MIRAATNEKPFYLFYSYFLFAAILIVLTSFCANATINHADTIFQAQSFEFDCKEIARHHINVLFRQNADHLKCEKAYNALYILIRIDVS